MLTTMEQRTIIPAGCVAAHLSGRTLAPSYGASADFMLFVVDKTVNTCLFVITFLVQIWLISRAEIIIGYTWPLPVKSNWTNVWRTGCSVRYFQFLISLCLEKLRVGYSIRQFQFWWSVCGDRPNCQTDVWRVGYSIRHFQFWWVCVWRLTQLSDKRMEDRILNRTFSV